MTKLLKPFQKIFITTKCIYIANRHTDIWEKGNIVIITNDNYRFYIKNNEDILNIFVKHKSHSGPIWNKLQVNIKIYCQVYSEKLLGIYQEIDIHKIEGYENTN